MSQQRIAHPLARDALAPDALPANFDDPEDAALAAALRSLTALTGEEDIDWGPPRDG